MSLEGEEKEEETSCGSPKSVAKQWNNKLLPMNLLDEYWFFHNTLHGSRRVVVPQTPLPSPNKSKEMSLMSSIQHTKAEKSSAGDSFADRALLRAPSPPQLHAGRKETAAEEENDEEVDVPRTSTSSSTPNNNKKPPLLRAPSMPSPQNSFNYFDSSSSSSPKKNLMRNASMGRNQVPRHTRKCCCCCTSLHYNYTRAFQEKKWRSSSDLESIEVQGFKDLGFVFDEVGPNDERLASVIPGLREKKAHVDDDGGSSNVKRPYLSEAWNAQRPAPPTLKWVAADKRSAADMKEQLKFWARAVACNVRQEC
ncbi:uncharacterized protein LOC109716866 [Ananas comosus]|uniref:Uncharacterized protein LOC109716866 n=2 Tax=Ananas comosus TaxID=4615 RepID=A0A6P5FQV3_ANACO|nr:uncharacterized protein LOC109716866 [Ananas comosus]CAD1842473.1 unnamed protein product [Ananas comosus var. bracteatus]